jgi:hypothetical protein
MALNNVPLTGQSLGVTRVPINQNFSVIDTAFSVDHVDYNDPNQGKHNQVTMPVQASPPTTAGGEIALFSQTSALTAVPEMAWERQSNGTVVEFTSAILAATGWSRIPSGLLLKWGTGNTVASPAGPTTITFPTGANIPAFTTIFSIQITTAYTNTGDSPNGFVRLNNFVTPWTSFTVFGSPRSSSGQSAIAFQYLAIGV